MAVRRVTDKYRPIPENRIGLLVGITIVLTGLAAGLALFETLAWATNNPVETGLGTAFFACWTYLTNNRSR